MTGNTCEPANIQCSSSCSSCQKQSGCMLASRNRGTSLLAKFTLRLAGRHLCGIETAVQSNHRVCAVSSVYWECCFPPTALKVCCAQ